jgi:hypothetical protein
VTDFTVPLSWLRALSFTGGFLVALVRLFSAGARRLSRRRRGGDGPSEG